MIDWWEATHQAAAEQVRFASDPEADQLIKENLVAFLIAAALDRRGQAREIWNIPLALMRRWGHLNPGIIQHMNPVDVASIPEIEHAPTQIARQVMGRTVVSVAIVVQEVGGGQASNLFDGNFKEILARLDRIFGVGEGIARMMVILRMLYFGLSPQPEGELLPKLDTHVQRVLLRSGTVTLCTDKQVREALAGCTARQVAIVDQAAWQIGQQWCRNSEPLCLECPLGLLCPKQGFSVPNMASTRSTRKAHDVG
jgi:endonuclease III